MIKYDLGIMYYLSKILVRILPWVPLLPRCSKNLARSCQDSQDASKRVNPGDDVMVTDTFCGLFSLIFERFNGGVTVW